MTWGKIVYDTVKFALRLLTTVFSSLFHRKMNSTTMAQFIPSRRMGLYEPIHHQMSMWPEFKGLETSAPQMILRADDAKLHDLSENTSLRTDKYDQETNKPDKVLRRLAQNREAARKSRLRKKSYVRQLESSELRLLQLEQEVQRARQQGLSVGGGGILDTNDQLISYSVTANPEIATFEIEYAQWVDEQNKQIADLRNALRSGVGDSELAIIVGGGIKHYDRLFVMKSKVAKVDVFYLMSGEWKTSVERFYFWIGGFRPSEILKVIIPHLEPLTEQQRADASNLRQSCLQTEDALSQGMEKLHHIIAEALGHRLGDESYLPQIRSAMDKLDSLARFVGQADYLRREILQQMLRVLTTRQAARGLLALNEYLRCLRALGSLWSSSRSRI